VGHTVIRGGRRHRSTFSFSKQPALQNLIRLKLFAGGGEFSERIDVKKFTLSKSIIL
jgi:hypothetical protein